MSGVRLVFNGLAELKAALLHLPADLTGEATHLVDGIANGAAADLKAAYPERTGHLRAGVSVTHVDRGTFSAGAIVKSTAPHAWLFDNGSQARHYITKNGKTHVTGAMPPTHVFVKTLVEARRRMWEQLRGLLERHGLVVSGDA